MAFGAVVARPGHLKTAGRLRAVSGLAVVLAAGAMLMAAPGTTAQAAESCPDDGARLPITGLCAGRAANYLNMVEGTLPDGPEGCSWTVQETEMPAGEVLLYMALQCGDKATKLTFEGGAQLAELKYETSAQLGDELKGQTLIKIASADPAAPTANVLSVARAAMEDQAEAAKCEVRPAGIEGWPADALVVDVSAAEAAKAPKDEPRAACGPFGLNEDSQAYWRVFQGFSWYFELGQDNAEIDPRSLTLMSKDEKGEWGQVP